MNHLSASNSNFLNNSNQKTNTKINGNFFLTLCIPLSDQHKVPQVIFIDLAITNLTGNNTLQFLTINFQSVGNFMSINYNGVRKKYDLGVRPIIQMANINFFFPIQMF